MCPRVCVCKGTVEMGKKAKKALILIALLVSLAALYAESFRFSIVWDKVIEADTSLAVVDLASDEAVTARALEIVSTVQDVARIRYASNEGGIHVLSYTAKTLGHDSDQNGHPFNLFFKYTENGSTNVQEIQVGPTKGSDYPSAPVVAATSINMGQGGDETPRYVLIQVELPDASVDSMLTNVTYTSTITITRTSP